MTMQNVGNWNKNKKKEFLKAAMKGKKATVNKMLQNNEYIVIHADFITHKFKYKDQDYTLAEIKKMIDDKTITEQVFLVYSTDLEESEFEKANKSDFAKLPPIQWVKT